MPKEETGSTFVRRLDAALFRWRLAAVLLWLGISGAPVIGLGRSSEMRICGLLVLLTQATALFCRAAARRAKQHARDRQAPKSLMLAARSSLLLAALSGVAGLVVLHAMLFGVHTEWGGVHRVCALGTDVVCVDVDAVGVWIVAFVFGVRAALQHFRLLAPMYAPRVVRRRMTRLRARIGPVCGAALMDALLAAALLFLLDGSGLMAAVVRGVGMGRIRPRPLSSLIGRTLAMFVACGLWAALWRLLSAAHDVLSTEVIDVGNIQRLPRDINEPANLMALRHPESTISVRAAAAAALERDMQSASLRRMWWRTPALFGLLLASLIIEVRRTSWSIHAGIARACGREFDAILPPEGPPSNVLSLSLEELCLHYAARRRRRSLAYARVLDDMEPMEMVRFRFAAMFCAVRNAVWPRGGLAGRGFLKQVFFDGGELALLTIRTMAGLLSSAPREDVHGVASRQNAAKRATQALDELIRALDLYALSGLAVGGSGEALMIATPDALALAAPIVAPSVASGGEATRGRLAQQPRRATATQVRHWQATPFALGLAAKHARRRVTDAFAAQ